MESLNLFDVIIIISGIYIIYSSVSMKASGKVTSHMLIGKNVNLEHAKDMKGFVDAMFMKSFLLGIFSIICGFTSWFNTAYLGNNPYISLIAYIVYILILVLYCIASAKAQKKYLM